MKINFQSLLYPSSSAISSSSHPNLHQSDSISIIIPNEPEPTLNLSKQFSLTKSKTNIQSTMKDLLESSMSNIPKRNQRLNTSIEESFISEESLEPKKWNFSGKMDNFSWKKMKQETLKLMEYQAKKERIVPRKNLHQTLHGQKVKTVKSRITKEMMYEKEKEKDANAEFQYSYKLKNRKKKLTRPNICQELYNQHRTSRIHNEIRNRFITHDITKQCTFHPTIPEKPQHLKNYKPLMERLEEELAKRKNQTEFMNYHKNINFTDEDSEMFKPKLKRTGINVKSKVYDFMKDREKSLETVRVSESSIEREMNSSKMSRTLNRSLEIIQSLEQDYVEKLMNKLFMSNQKVHISADTISRLQEEQFEIICPFIQDIQRDGVDFDRDQFRERFLSFFNKLTVDKKHDLKFMYRKEKRKILNPEKNQKVKKSKMEGDSYISKLEQFV